MMMMIKALPSAPEGWTPAFLSTSHKQGDSSILFNGNNSFSLEDGVGGKASGARQGVTRSAVPAVPVCGDEHGPGPRGRQCPSPRGRTRPRRAPGTRRRGSRGAPPAEARPRPGSQTGRGGRLPGRSASQDGVGGSLLVPSSGKPFSRLHPVHPPL